MKGKLILLFIILVGVVNSEGAYDGINQYEDFAVPDLKAICLNYNITDMVSESCGEQLSVVCQNNSLLSTMLDASSKYPYTGLSFSTTSDYGNFDECMSVDHKYEGGRILGEHCTVGLIIPDLFGNISNPSVYYTLAVCRPDKCTAADFNTIISNLSNSTFSLFQDSYCQTIYTDSEFTTTDIITIFIFAACIMLMIISTAYHFYLDKKQLESPRQIYLAFSVLYNGKKLLNTTQPSKDQINTFHGLRVISMMWIIAGHGVSMWTGFGIINVPHAREWQSKMSSVYITAAPLAVDTFFFISGFLLAYQYLKQKPKPFIAHVKTIPSMYLYRYLRLTPALAMLFLVALSLLKHLGSGPLWGAIDGYTSTPCKKYWWSLFLYIQNYYNHSDQKLCLIVTWYLSADMQMFLLSPLVIIPIAVYLQRSNGFAISMIQMYILNIFFIALPLAIKLVFQDYTNILTQVQYLYCLSFLYVIDLYFCRCSLALQLTILFSAYDTHSRLIDYFIGVTLGIFMRVKQEKHFLYVVNSRRRSIINLLIWIIVLCGMFAIFLCHREFELHHGYVSQTIFTSVMRPAWCICLSWIVYACHCGYGGVINWILSLPIFQVWGRLTYCMYLMQMLTILIYLGKLRTRSFFSDYNAFYNFCGHFILTLCLSVFWTLAFESPLLTIEKVLFRERKKSSREVNP